MPSTSKKQIPFSLSLSLHASTLSVGRLKTMKALNPCFLSSFLPRIFGLSTNEERTVQACLDAVTGSRKRLSWA